MNRALCEGTTVVAVWMFAGVALLLALVALGAVRRLSRRLDALNQSYWELRYDYTRLRSQVARLDRTAQNRSPLPDPQIHEWDAPARFSLPSISVRTVFTWSWRARPTASW